MRMKFAIGLALMLHTASVAEDAVQSGLWVGSVHVTHVEDPLGNLEPVEVPFEFGLIIHLDSGGAAKLVSQAIVIGEVAEETNDRKRRVIAGKDVTRTHLAEYTSDALANAEKYATVGYDFPMGVLNMVGEFGGSGSLMASIEIGPFDDENPFRHRFHPDHDNLSEMGGPLTDDAEVFALSRQMHFAFDQEQSSRTRVLGTFSETISGLAAADVIVQGLFVLEQVFRDGGGS